MKKNNMLRIASVLLVAVLLSTCAISGVFAYYYTTDADNDSARVAKWGVVVDATSDAFSTQYDLGESKLTVKAEEKVVAPGTDGALADITVTGTPEVAVKVTKTADIALTGWIVPTGVADDESTTDIDESKKEYCPIVFTVNGKEYKQGKQTIAEFEKAVERAILGKNDDGNNTAVYEFPTNTDLSADDLDLDVDVNWAWAIGTMNADDTALGDQAADTNKNNDSKIAVNVSILVEQVGD